MFDLSSIDLLGYAAAGLVLATFCARSLTALRALAMTSNVLFIAYAACAALPPVLVLHALLLPLNALRLRQAMAEKCCAVEQPLPRVAAALARKRFSWTLRRRSRGGGSGGGPRWGGPDRRTRTRRHREPRATPLNLRGAKPAA
jgi:hypothetical protein